jgi:hypothetical protein
MTTPPPPQTRLSLNARTRWVRPNPEGQFMSSHYNVASRCPALLREFLSSFRQMQGEQASKYPTPAFFHTISIWLSILLTQLQHIYKVVATRWSQFQWPRALMHGSAVPLLPRLWVRIPPRVWVSLVSVVCCQVEVSATGLSLVRGSHTECVCVCVLLSVFKGKSSRYAYNE